MARILLAEDDAAVRDFAFRVLSRAGHDVVAAHEGQEALRCVTVPDAPFDLLVSDIRMPVIDGMTLSKLVHRHVPKMPILLMTGYSDADQGTLPPSVIGILQKPFTIEMLEDAVNKGLGPAVRRVAKG